MPKDGWGAADPGAFLAELRAEGYRGEIASDAATRSVYATDNSIYELTPQAVLFPRHPGDLNLIAAAAGRHRIAIAARGGGTGTNGQSLTDSVAVDCSKHLTAIEEINAAQRYAIVQPGVILDDLNRAAARHGLFFAPSVSTASRATLGGMAATDASGKGSRIYGRTSDHVLAIDAVLADGRALTARAMAEDAFRGAEDAAVPRAIRDTLCAILDSAAEEIARVSPKMNRGLTGYNLAQLRRDGEISLVKLLCGSEGTLALTKRLKLRLLPLPAHRALVVIAYDGTAAALQDVPRLVAADPSAIEFIDDNILELARQDPVWDAVSSALRTDGGRVVRGLSFAEVQADSPQELRRRLDAFAALTRSQPGTVIGQREVTCPDQIREIWQLRAKCVGLLGRMDPSRQGTPFVEDAAVPAENLPAFVEGFRAILDARGLSYGMFGHSDAGCVHVRPALDMRLAGDAGQVRGISDEVHRLALAHGGLIWGEHGKGFRSEYVPDVFGPRLYSALCRIKAAFDPGNLLNPGKIASPCPDRDLVPLDGVPFRGSLDADIAPPLAEVYGKAVRCNGNGQCMGRDAGEAMCPSYKATGDRLRSPKGRSALLREWARRQSRGRAAGDAAFEEVLYDSLSDCLGCKACATQCPVKVDIPAMRSRFYQSYFAGRRRPPGHWLMALLEPAGLVLRRAPRLANLSLALAAPVLGRAGLVDIPRLSPSRRRRGRAGHASAKGQVILVEDFFLGSFDGRVLDCASALLRHLGFGVARSGVLASGKPLHVLGFRTSFGKTARRTLARLRALQAGGAQLVSVEPSFTAMFASEYRELEAELPDVVPVEAFLSGAIETGLLEDFRAAGGEGPHAAPVSLFQHCSESAQGPEAAQAWARIFAHFGVNAVPARTGCCGMAGMFGHEKSKIQMSRRLYDLSWSRKISTSGGRLAVTGFSCRCQVRRMSALDPEHPAETLLKILRDGGEITRAHTRHRATS